jgi:hypothetical protein
MNKILENSTYILCMSSMQGTDMLLFTIQVFASPSDESSAPS